MPNTGLKIVQVNRHRLRRTYDIGYNKADMIHGTSTKELVFFVVDSLKLPLDFDITVSGTYDVLDYGDDDANGGRVMITVLQALDPFYFTVDIA